MRTSAPIHCSLSAQRARTFAVLGVILQVALSLPGTALRADHREVAQQLAGSRSQYQTAEQWATRREQLRQHFLEGAGLAPLPERPPVRVISHSLRRYRDYSVENVALETLPGFYCTGNLYRPVGRKDIGPAILCPHGHFRPLGRYRENHQIRCAHLARMGATVFSYSMVGWQDSTQTTHDDPLVLALQTWNSLRAVDFLAGLERIDASRIGVTGASGGGTQSFFLALIDDRIAASAPLVIVYPWKAPEGCLCEGGLPVMQAAKTNAIELAAATSPRPQLLISVGNDPTSTFPETGFPFIRHMYEVAGAGDLVENLHLPDEAHDFGPTKRRAVYQFFAKHFGMGPDGFSADSKNPATRGTAPAEDLAQITIETPEKMAVFDAQHPLPSNAVHGHEAVAATFRTYLSTLRQQDSAAETTARPMRLPIADYSFKTADASDEALLFTAPGFTHVGEPRTAQGPQRGRLTITVVDAATGQPTPSRVNVVGPDGHYYEPAGHSLKPYSLTGVWPHSGWGNRQGKAPIRYFGRYFYTKGTDTVEVPTGTVRIEAWKGFEYRPATQTIQVTADTDSSVTIELHHTARMPREGYWSGDPHVHIPRRSPAEEQQILDLMQAEDIHYATLLAYNEPAGPYAGFMNQMDSPQLRGVGPRSIISRDDYTIISAQEYRSSTYGHLNLFGLDELVLDEQSLNANNWPPFGHIARSARELGGVAFYAHGGYAQEIYADVAQDNIDGVELLQFGVYRGIGLEDWYHMLNAGFRIPASGACDYPACRKLGDCKTYVYHDSQPRTPPRMTDWLNGLKAGRSFFTTGPLLLLEVDGHRPGARVSLPEDAPQLVTARVRVRSEVTPVTHVQLIANGRVVEQIAVPAETAQGAWIELTHRLPVQTSTWIAARAFSLSSTGSPDAESHTNPVYIEVGGKAVYEQASLDRLVTAIDGQIAVHKKRQFDEQSRVINYFERARDVLMTVRAAGGASAEGHPSDLLDRSTAEFDPGQREHSDAELRAFLKPLPAKPIDEVLRSFETVDGFEMQLVAREPLVRDPICGAFDEDGNLYVGEMRDYPYKPAEGDEPIGAVRLLRDVDGDGKFDESHVFADRLLWVGGIAPWKGGVYVAAPPDIWYLKDSDGDHVADIKRRVYTGFGTGNQQAMLNNLTWGLDHYIYGSTAGNGGEVHHVDSRATDRRSVNVNGHDFRFDPVTERFEAITGTVQFGNTFDDWGNRFLCSESRPLLHAVLPEHYLARNPYLPVPYALNHLTDGPVPIFRSSPLERWRMIRSSRRIAHGARSANAAGASHHVIDAAAGVTVYRGGAYPAEYYGNIFIGGAQNNVIHRRQVIADGVTFRSERLDDGTEFARSSDNWFRPVNFINAPDGTLYCLDMSREILETIHVPLDVTRFLDFTSGRNHGRIYRIAPRNFRVPDPPRLSQATASELVEALNSPHGWWRDTAHRLLFEKQDRSVAVSLKQLVSKSQTPQTRLHALWSLQGLGELSDDDVFAALSDQHPAILEHGMRLAESRLDDEHRLLRRVIELSRRQEPRLRFQAAFSLGESRSDEAAVALANLARSTAGDRWLQTAILSSTAELADRMLIEFLGDPQFLQTADGRRWLQQLAQIVGARHGSAELSRVLAALADDARQSGSPQRARTLVMAIGSALRATGRRLNSTQVDSATARQLLQQLLDDAVGTAADSTADPADRITAIQLLSCFPLSAVLESFDPLLDVQQPDAIRLATVNAFATYSDADIATRLLTPWRTWSPQLRQQVIEALLSRTAWTLAFLQAAEAGDASVAYVPAARRSLLTGHSNAEIRELANRLFGATTTARAEVVKTYRQALKLPAEAERGQQIFRRDCMACHRIGQTGNAIGPDLASSPSRDAVALLTHILDPNRYLLPNFESYIVVDTNGRTLTGMIAAQTATSITLKREENRTDTILRTNIEELSGTGRSLMPEGFEKKISLQEMADLIAFLQASLKKPETAPSTQPPPLGIGTLPGLVEPKKSKSDQ